MSFTSLLGAPKLAMSSLLALSGALVLLVIVALSNPFEGDLAISDQPFRKTAHGGQLGVLPQRWRRWVLGEDDPS